ncbi:MAG: ATP-binding protein [Eubacterium sp.]|nr:ATP-binding protein [Eubacterium sp.]MDY5498364.1 ATP-binding protein [Anaerobutyricum sp.]
MALSTAQYQEIMKEYDEVRRRNYMTEQERKELVYQKIPEIREIDRKIAHISIAKAKEMVQKKVPDARESLRESIYELSMEKINLLAIHDFPADYLDPIYDCPKCRDTGYIGSEKCSCLNEKASSLLRKQSNMEGSIARENFANFCTEYYSPVPSGKERVSPRENICSILSQSHRFIEDFDRNPGQNLLIYGNAGVGKTFLSNCIGGELLSKGKNVLYLTAYQFFDRLADYTFRRKEENARTLPDFLHCDLLIIDDLGTELNNSFINSQLFLCMNERILNKKSTIISTNLSLERISHVYTERVFSRIIQSYTLFHIYGEDIRIKKAVSSLDKN